MLLLRFLIVVRLKMEKVEWLFRLKIIRHIICETLVVIGQKLRFLWGFNILEESHAVTMRFIKLIKKYI